MSLQKILGFEPLLVQSIDAKMVRHRKRKGANSLMQMPPLLRKLSLTVHIVFSVGWLGSAVAYLALAIVGLRGTDPQLVRSAYLAMGVIGSFIIVPLSLAALISGLIQALGTAWGLFRHYWVLTKLVLTLAATTILIIHMRTVNEMSQMAAESNFASLDLGKLPVQLVVHAAGGLFVLLLVTALSVFKPRSLTPYGSRILNRPK